MEKIRKIDFLQTKREWVVAFGALLGVFCLSLGWKWWVFDSYMCGGKQAIEARVLNQYPKGDKWVLKLKSEHGMILYATSKEKLKDLQNRHLRIFGKPANCDFLQSLRSCFFVAYSMALLPRDYRFTFYDFVSSQHTENFMGRFYMTLFFATALPKELREIASKLKISHLLAISGLHLGILFASFLFLLAPLYRFFQAHFFTYRNAIFDLSFLANLFLLAYLFLLDFPPSFLRAYVMSLLAFVFLFCHLGLLNFSFLFLCLALILALFPDFLFSIGLWFSIAGVFYIFLFFKHFPLRSTGWLRIALIACLLNTVLFFNMLIPTHYFFPAFSLYSFLAIPLSLLFAPFFVLVLLLHLLGFGELLDPWILRVLSWEIPSVEVFTPPILLCIYGVLSLWSVVSLWAYWLSLGMGAGFCVFLLFKSL